MPELKRSAPEQPETSPSGHEEARTSSGHATRQALSLPDAPVLLLCGDSPETRATAVLAWQCGFLLDIVDEKEGTIPLEKLYPMARRCHILPSYDDLVRSCAIGREHLVVIMTRDWTVSCHVLSQALESHAAYVGMRGGRNKRRQIYGLLREQGMPRAELAAVRCPVGLSIGAKSPQQIAVAVVAELLAAREGTLHRLRLEE